MAPQRCKVCSDAQSKYKCPSCLLPYCSLACFKKHKETPCQKSLPPAEESTTRVIPKKLYGVDEPDYVLDKKQLQSIVNTNEIREMLKNGKLKKLIRKVDNSEDQFEELAIVEVQYGEFIDKILSVVSPQEKSP